MPMSNLNPMGEEARITVSAIIPSDSPRKSARIKDSRGLMFSVWPNKLGLFNVGNTYDIEFTETDKNGVTYRDIKSAKQITQPGQLNNARGNFDVIDNADSAYDRPAPKPQAVPAPVAAASPYQDATAKRIFVCGIVNNAVSARLVDPFNADSLVELTTAACAAWDRTLAKG